MRVTCLARASMLFSMNSATALSGLLWESAMMRIAFQLSPIRNLPASVVFNAAINGLSSIENQARNQALLVPGSAGVSPTRPFGLVDRAKPHVSMTATQRNIDNFAETGFSRDLSE